MAVVVLTPKTIDYNGVEGYSDTPDYAAATAADGFEFVNDGKTVLHIKNTDSGNCTATVVSPQPCALGGTTVHNVAVVIPNAEDWFIGVLPTNRFNATSTGKVTVSLVASADVTKILACAYKLT